MRVSPVVVVQGLTADSISCFYQVVGGPEGKRLTPEPRIAKRHDERGEPTHEENASILKNHISQQGPVHKVA